LSIVAGTPFCAKVVESYIAETGDNEEANRALSHGRSVLLDASFIRHALCAKRLISWKFCPLDQKGRELWLLKR